MNSLFRTAGTLIRVTGINKALGARKVISFFTQYVAFDGPEVVRLSGVGLMLLIGLTHMYEFPEHFEAATYIGLSFAALFVGTLVAAFSIMIGKKRGWPLGAALCVVAIVGYVISRTWGLPGLLDRVARWDTPAGTFAVGAELAFLALYASILIGINVTYPDRQGWTD